MLDLPHTSQKCVLNWHSFNHCFLIAFLSLVSNCCTPIESFPASLSGPARLQSDLQGFPENMKNTCMARLAPSWIQSITVSGTTTSSGETIRREQPNRCAFESYATNKPENGMFILALPVFWTPAFTSPIVFWMAAWDKPNTDMRRRKSSERNHYTEFNERSQKYTGEASPHWHCC